MDHNVTDQDLLSQILGPRHQPQSPARDLMSPPGSPVPRSLFSDAEEEEEVDDGTVRRSSKRTVRAPSSQPSTVYEFKDDSPQQPDPAPENKAPEPEVKSDPRCEFVDRFLGRCKKLKAQPRSYACADHQCKDCVNENEYFIRAALPRSRGGRHTLCSMHANQAHRKNLKKDRARYAVCFTVPDTEDSRRGCWCAGSQGDPRCR